MNVGNAATKRRRASHLGPDRRRPQVLDAALKLAAEQGLQAVSMEALARQLKVSKPVIYACYGSRSELLGALLTREEQRLLKDVLAALPRWPLVGDPRQLVGQGFQALLKTAAANADSWKLVFSAQPDPAIAERYHHARRRVEQQVAEMMKLLLTIAGVNDIPRKLPVLVELFMSVGDGAVRTMIDPDNRQTWTPDELGAFVGQLVYGAFANA